MKAKIALTSLKKKFTKEESNALRFRRAGDLMNYLRRLKEARRLRMEYYELNKQQHNRIKPTRKDDDGFWN